jgi:hypothetical protein
MNDAGETPMRRPAVVRPRDAASLILLRGEGEGLEVLVGRRSPRAKFMPGVTVFPGGGIEAADRLCWSVEAGTESLAPRLRQSARAALRETWESRRASADHYRPITPRRQMTWVTAPAVPCYNRRDRGAADR